MRVETKDDQRVPESPDFRRTGVRHHVRVLPRVQVSGCAQRAHPVQGGDLPARLSGPLSDGRTGIRRTFTAAAATTPAPVRAGGQKRPAERSFGLCPNGCRKHGSAERPSADGGAHSVRLHRSQ